MGISSSADYAGIKDDFDEPELSSQVIAPARARTPSPSLQSGPPPSYDSATKPKKVLEVLYFRRFLFIEICWLKLDSQTEIVTCDPNLRILKPKIVSKFDSSLFLVVNHLCLT